MYKQHKYKEGDKVYVKFYPSSCPEEAYVLNRWHEDNGDCYYDLKIIDGSYESGGWKIAMNEKRIHCKLESNPNIK